MTVTTCHTAAMTHVGERIRARREELGMTQAQLAHKIGADSVSVVKAWERRPNLPSRTSIYTERIEHVLDLVLDEKAERNQPYDPPISEAPDTLLVAELARRLAIASAEGQSTGQGTVTPFGVRGMSTSDEGRRRTGEG